MKNTKLLACLLALATVAGATSALASHSVVSLGAGAQYWDAKDADDLDEDGMFGGGLILRVQPSDYFGIDFRAGAVGVWDSHKYRVDGTKYERDSTLYCCPFELGLVLAFPLSDAISIYGGPGVGYYYYDIDIETSSKHGHHYHSERSEHIELEDDFGWYAVAGLKIDLVPGFSIFGEARYTETETSLKHGNGSEFDASGFGAMGGFMINF